MANLRNLRVVLIWCMASIAIISCDSLSNVTKTTIPSNSTTTTNSTRINEVQIKKTTDPVKSNLTTSTNVHDAPHDAQIIANSSPGANKKLNVTHTPREGVAVTPSSTASPKLPTTSKPIQKTEGDNSQGNNKTNPVDIRPKSKSEETIVPNTKHETSSKSQLNSTVAANNSMTSSSTVNEANKSSSPGEKIKVNPAPPVNANNKTQPTTTTTTTMKPTIITTKTTTPIPKKPKITYSIEDNPSLLKVPTPKLNQTRRGPILGDKISVDEIEQPIVQPSQEFNPNLRHQHPYVIPMITFIFAVPIVLGISVVVFRRIKDYWSTRHYRRMDFLVDGMYND